MGLPGVKFPGLGTPGPKNMSGTWTAKAASPTHEFASVASAVDCNFPPSGPVGWTMAVWSKPPFPNQSEFKIEAAPALLGKSVLRRGMCP
jgi:hypothetical protein